MIYVNELINFILILLCMFQNAPTVVVKAVFDTCFVSTVQIVLESEDHGEMQVRAKTIQLYIQYSLCIVRCICIFCSFPVV